MNIDELRAISKKAQAKEENEIEIEIAKQQVIDVFALAMAEAKKGSWHVGSLKLTPTTRRMLGDLGFVLEEDPWHGISVSWRTRTQLDEDTL